MIYIEKSNVADTRTCNWSKVSMHELFKASVSHIHDVQQGMNFWSQKINKIGMSHDHTKLTGINDFYKDFQTGFKNRTWYENHQDVERHHLSNEKYIQEDVNLLDILEMITDGVMAGMARSGEYRKEELSDKLLRKAFDNTIKLLLDNVKVVK